MRADLPEGLEAHAESPLFTEETLPQKLRSRHALKAGTWGKLIMLSGALDYIQPGAEVERTSLKEGDAIAIPPETPHWVEPRGALRCKIVFHRPLPLEKA